MDFNGWSPANELIDINLKACGERRPHCELEVVEVFDDLTTFCEMNHHRKPDQFLHDPRPRARNYLTKTGLPQGLTPKYMSATRCDGVALGEGRSEWPPLP